MFLLYYRAGVSNASKSSGQMREAGLVCMLNWDLFPMLCAAPVVINVMIWSGVCVACSVWAGCGTAQGMAFM